MWAYAAECASVKCLSRSVADVGTWACFQTASGYAIVNAISWILTHTYGTYMYGIWICKPKVTHPQSYHKFSQKYTFISIHNPTYVGIFIYTSTYVNQALSTTLSSHYAKYKKGALIFAKFERLSSRKKVQRKNVNTSAVSILFLLLCYLFLFSLFVCETGCHS